MSEYTYITDDASLETWVMPDVMRAKAVGLDIETTGLDPLTDRVRLVQLATEQHVYIIDAFHVDLAPLQEFLDLGPRIVGHNLRFDLGWLVRMPNGLTMPSDIGKRLTDTELASRLIDAGRFEARIPPKKGEYGWHSLAALAHRELGTSLDKQYQVSDWSQPELTPEQLAYAAEDARVVMQLRPILGRRLKRAGLLYAYSIESRCLPAMIWLDQTGAPFDADAWLSLSGPAKVKAEARKAELNAMAGREINWASPKQVKEMLDSRGVVLAKTDKPTLVQNADRDPLIPLLLKYRKESKAITSFGPDFLRFVHPVTKRIHAGFRQMGADSGRMSCSNPNLQQIPKASDYRACFRAEPGNALIACDYSQIELRVTAEITSDPALLDAYRNGEDLHTKTARSVLGAEGEITIEQRKAAKALNFGLDFGMGAKKFKLYSLVNYDVKLSDYEATKLRKAWMTTYAGIKAWHQRVGHEEPTETRTLTGRRRLETTTFSERLNTPVQGTAGDGIKIALALLWENHNQHPTARPVLVVHDEIVMECPSSDAKEVAEWLQQTMVDGMQPLLTKVPVVAEVTIGRDWAGSEDEDCDPELLSAA